MYAHYASVWAELERESFVIVLLGAIVKLDAQAVPSAREFLVRVTELDYEVVYLDEIVFRKIKYRYVVSNHIMGGGQPTQENGESRLQEVKRRGRNLRKSMLNTACRLVSQPRKYQYEIDPFQYLPLQAGIGQIRFMYGADISDAWSLDAWNSIYDLFLCHGPNDELQLKSRFSGKTAIMGYPRYDGYFSPTLDVAGVASEFALDPAKKTLLWMPTYDAFKDDVCSIPYFTEPLTILVNQFNLIVRPHPISFRLDPNGIRLLEEQGFRIDKDPLRDMNQMFKVADTVLCDHGGSAFGALYLGKKLVFLKTPAKDTAVVSKASSNLDLMRHFPTIKPDEVSSLPALVEDESYWQSKLMDARKLSDQYFANYRGNASKKTAEILRNLDTLLEREA